MGNPFDLKTALLARHAQHVVLIHFPIALFIAAVAFDLLAQCTAHATAHSAGHATGHARKTRALADAAYYNLLAAAISVLPVLATGVLAWQFQLEGQKLKGILLLHLVLACLSSAVIGVVWWMHFRARRGAGVRPIYRLSLEFLGVTLIALSAHLGGFLSGVNSPS